MAARRFYVRAHCIGDRMAELPQGLQSALSGRYRLIRELGSGGMATVYLADDARHRRQVALKVLRPDLTAALGSDRFLREIETTAQLTHPHILPLLDSGDAGGTLYYVMPFVEGESLRERLAREKQLPLDDAVRICREVGDALVYAHGRGVVHRDIKPENILLASGHAVVADFGIARAVDEAGGGRLTETGVALGTPAYMSPEQVTGSRDLDGRSDLYALGCVLYELLAGQPPFTGPTAESVVRQHLAVEVPAVTALRPAVPAGIAAALVRAMAKTPADRFGSVAQFCDALGGPAPAAPSGTGPQPPAHEGRNSRRPRPAAVALAAVALVAGVGYGALRLFGGSGAGADRSVAVLTFETYGSDTGAAYLAEGLADGVSTALGKLDRLRVTSRTAVRRVAEAARLDPAQLGRMLHASNLVGGTIQRVADHVRVTVELLRAQSGEELWSERYDTTSADILGVQAGIAEAVAGRVAGRLLPRERAGLERRPTANPEAYDHYLRGNRLLWSPSEESVSAAIAQYLAALALDSTFSGAWGRLAQAYGHAVNYAFTPGGQRADELMARGMAAADHALAADSSVADGWLARGTLLSLRGGRSDFVEARQALARAVALDPSNDAAHHWYAVVLRRLGRFDQAEQEYYRVLAIDSTAVNAVADLGFLAYSRRSYADAVRWYDRAVALDSTSEIDYGLLARARLAAGDTAGALAAARASLRARQAGDRTRALAVLAEVEYRTGNVAAARGHLGSALRELEGPGHALPAVISVRRSYDCALAAVALGDRDLALRILERTRPRGPWLWSYLIWQGFDPIRRDPRFTKIIDEARPPGAKDPV